MDLHEYEDYLNDLGISDSAVKQKLSHIHMIYDECGAFTEKKVKEFLRKKRHEDKALLSTINKYISSVKTYCQYTKIQFKEPLKRKAERDSVETVVLTDEQIDSIINLKDTFHSIYFLVLSRTAARPSEILNLTQDDISGEVIFLPTGKTGGRYLPIPVYVAKKLGKYMQSIHSHYIFPSPDNSDKPVTWDAMNREFKRRIATLNIIKRAKLTSFRHSRAYALADCMSLKDLQSMLGHSKIETTGRYLRTNLKRLQKGIRKDTINRNFLPLTDIFEMCVKDILNRVEEDEPVLKIAISRTNNTLDLHIEY